MSEKRKVHEPGECFDSAYGKDCDGMAEYVPDPYAEEIHEVTIYDWFCPGVYTGHCMDI